MAIKLNEGLLASFKVKQNNTKKHKKQKKHKRNFTHNHMTKNMPDNLKMHNFLELPRELRTQNSDLILSYKKLGLLKQYWRIKFETYNTKFKDLL